MLEPIDIDINMNQNVSVEAGKAASASDNMAREVARLEKLVKDLSVALEEQQKQTASSNADNAKYTTQIKEIQAALEQANKELGVYKTAVEQANKAASEGADVSDVLSDTKQGLNEIEDGLLEVSKKASVMGGMLNEEILEVVELIQIEKKVINELDNDIASLTKELGVMEASMSGKGMDAFGTADSPARKEYEALKKQLQELNDERKVEKERLDELHNEYNKLNVNLQNETQEREKQIEVQSETSEATKKGSKAASTYSAQNSLLSLSIREVCKGLGIENSQVVSLLGNVSVIQAAKTGWANAVKVLNTNLGISIGLSRALLLTGIGLLVAGIAAAVLVYKNWNKEQDEANKLMLERNKFHADVVNSVQTEITKVQVLEKILKDSNNTYAQRNKALDDLKSIMPEYNALLDKEGHLIEDNTNALDKYIKKLMDVALAKGAMDKFVAAQNSLTQKMADLTPEQQELYKIPLKDIVNNPKYSQKEVIGWFAIDDYLSQEKKSVELWEKEVIKYTKQGIDTVVDNTKEYWEKRQTDALAAMARLTPEDKENKSTAWVAAENSYRRASKKLKTWDIKASDNDYKKEETAAEKRAKKLKADGEKLEKISYDLQQRIDAARVKAIGEGAEKERQAVKAEYDQTKAFLEQKYKEVDELEKATGKPATEQRTLLLSLDVEATRQYEAEVGRINAQSKATIDSIFTEVNARFTSELDSNITKINVYYDELIRNAIKAGASIQEIEILNAARSKDLSLEKINNETSVLNFEEEIASRRTELSNKRYLFESDKLKAQLLQEREFAKKRLEIAQKQYNINPTVEAAQNLKFAQNSVDELTNKLLKLPGQKMREVANYASMLASSLENITGFDFSVLNESLNGLASFASGDVLGSVSSGLNILTGFVGGILNKKEREIQIQHEINRLQQQYNIDLRQQNYDLISSIDYARAFRDNLEALQWLVEKGFISNVDYSAWETLNAKVQEANKNVLAAQQNYNKVNANSEDFLNEAYRLRNKPVWNKYKDIVEDWKNGLISTEEAQRRFAASGVKGAAEQADAIARAKDETQKWKDEIVELSRQMDEFATGTSFDGFLNDATNAVRSMYGDITSLADFTEDALTNAILSSFKYQILSAALKPFYDELSDKFIQDFDNLDRAWGDDWKARLQAELGNKGKVLEDLFNSLGIESEGKRQGATGGLATASQDSINELTGGVYAVRQIMGDIRNDNREELLIQRTIVGQISLLVERSEDWEHLRQLPKVVQKLEEIETYGLKMKV